MNNKVLITGCSGFIGKNAVNHFLNNKYDVYGISSKYNSAIKKKNFLKKSSNKIKTINFLRINNPNIIIFAHGTIDHTSAFEKVYKDHFILTKMIIDYVDKKYLKKIIFLSSGDEYGIPLSLPIDEKTPCYPKTNYGLIKNLSSNYILKSYSDIKDKHISIFILRLFLIYGENQKIPRLIPLLKDSINKNKLLKINSKNSKKNFTHINDLLNYFEKIIKYKKKFKGIINFGSNNNLKIIDIIKIIEKKYMCKLNIKFDNKKIHNNYSLYPNNKKLISMFGKYYFKKFDIDII